MKHLAVWAVLVCAATVARGGPTPPAPAPSAIHPAVVRVIVTDRDGTTFGSGALVSVSANYGLVLTNWHVVREVAGPITVLFPDGFGSLATVLRIDRDWDLAALAIRRPNVPPIPLAVQPPRPGEMLTIAGYGKGWYRAASGSCTQYLSPGGNLPCEMVELAAPARQGDSGGPILNSRGELAGVLFGTGMGRTMGSYCGRVRWFVGSVAGDFDRLPGNATMIARQPPSAAPPVAAISAASPPPAAVRPTQPVPSQPNVRLQATVPPQPRRENISPTRSPAAPPATQAAAPYTANEPARMAGPINPVQVSGPLEPACIDVAPSARLDQLKTILAGVGLVLLIFEGMRVAARATG